MRLLPRKMSLVLFIVGILLSILAGNLSAQLKVKDPLPDRKPIENAYILANSNIDNPVVRVYFKGDEDDEYIDANLSEIIPSSDRKCELIRTSHFKGYHIEMYKGLLEKLSRTLSIDQKDIAALK